MRLTHHSNYAMRLLMYCALMDKPVCRIADVADAFGISENHLTKIAQKLSQIGVIETVRGRNGGVSLAKTPEEVNVGEIIRVTEENLILVECFSEETNTCPITAACRFKRILQQGLMAFLSVLDGYTLADLIASPDQLKPLMKLADMQLDAVEGAAKVSMSAAE